jgi:hypothetical protein
MHTSAEPTATHAASEPTAMHAASEAAAMAATEAAATTAAAVEGESRRCERKRGAERAHDRAFEKPVHPDASVVSNRSDGSRRRKKAISRAKSCSNFN